MQITLPIYLMEIYCTMKSLILKLTVVLLILSSSMVDCSLAMEFSNPEQQQAKKRKNLEMGEDLSSKDDDSELLEPSFKRQRHEEPEDRLPSDASRADSDPMDLDGPEAESEALLESALVRYPMTEEDISFMRLDTLPSDSIKLSSQDMAALQEGWGSAFALDSRTGWLNLPVPLFLTPSKKLVSDPSLLDSRPQFLRSEAPSLNPPLKLKWSDTEAPWVDLLPSDVWHFPIFSTFYLYDLGRFEEVSTGCQALCTNDVWKRVGQVIQGHYGPEFVLNRESIKIHLLRVKLLTLPAELRDEKMKTQPYASLPISSLPSPRFGDIYNLMLREQLEHFTSLSHDLSALFPTFKAEAIKKENKRLKKEKLTGLVHGQQGYSKNPQKAMEYNEELVKSEDPDAIERKISGLDRGTWGYAKNREAALELNEKFVKLKDPRALERKYDGLKRKRWGYQRNLRAAREFNEEMVADGNQSAINRKIAGLSHGINGYMQNPQDLNTFIDLLIKNNNEAAIQLRYHELRDNPDPSFRNAANELLEGAINTGSVWAILEKYHSLQDEDADLQLLPKVQFDLLKNVAQQGHEVALLILVKKFLSDYSLSREKQKLFLENFNVLHTILTEKNNIIARYVKALIMHGNFWDYQTNPYETINYIRRHYIVL